MYESPEVLASFSATELVGDAYGDQDGHQGSSFNGHFDD